MKDPPMPRNTLPLVVLLVLLALPAGFFFGGPPNQPDVGMPAAAAPATLAPAATLPGATPLGRHVEDFTLRDFRGKARALHDLADRKAVVIIFLGTACPLARLYGPRLADLAEVF